MSLQEEFTSGAGPNEEFLYGSESNLEGGSDGMMLPPWARAGVAGGSAGAGAPTRVSGASRYTAQLLKRRGSAVGSLGGSVSPVARTPSASSPVSRTSSGEHRAALNGAAFERRPSVGGAFPQSPVQTAQRDGQRYLSDRAAPGGAAFESRTERRPSGGGPAFERRPSSSGAFPQSPVQRAQRDGHPNLSEQLARQG